MDERVMLVCSATGSTIGYFAPEVVEGLRAASNGKHVVVNTDAMPVIVWVIDGDILSEEYASGRYLICSHCGEIIDTANNWDFNEDENGTYCGRCCSELLTYCDRCDTWHPKDETVVVHTGFDSQYTEHWCRDCVEGRAFICEVCGEAHELRAQVHVPNHEKPICRSCCERLYFHCDRCGDFFSREEQHNHDELTGDSLCNSCMESVTEWRNRPVECDHCHNTVRQIEITNVPSHTEYESVSLCPECHAAHVTTCEVCGRAFYVTEEHPATLLTGGRVVCPHCARTRTFTCADCGGLFHRNERFTHDGAFYCRNCESRHRPIQVITGYHRYGGNSSQVWKFRSLEELDMFKTLFMGVELEIDNGGTSHTNAVQITTALGFPAQDSNEFKCTTDGSLNNGFEIISMPATYEYHLTKYDWKAGMRKAAALGYSSHDANTCGLHIHVNRSYFQQSLENPEKSTLILMCNNRPWLEKFSRRTRWSYCEFKGGGKTFKVDDFKATSENESHRREVDEWLQNLIGYCKGHYSMVNFNNHATIEFRLFRGTLKYRTFVATLQLVKMMCYAIKHFRREQLVNVDLRWFKKFATNNNYTEFLEYLAERGIMI